MGTKPQKWISTAQLKALVAKKWGPPDCAALFEVPNGTGGEKVRTCDVLAMSLWKSRGLDIMGAELKVSRGDWLTERRNPAKAESMFRFCTFWWLITGPGVVLDISEIPEKWGWMEAVSGVLKIRKPAPRLTPDPPSVHLMASLFRKIGAGIPSGLIARDSISEEIAEQRKAWKEASDLSVKVATDALQRERDSHHELRGLLSEAMREAGIRDRGNHYFLDTKDLKELAAGIKAMRTDGARLLEKLQTIAAEVASAVPALTTALERLAALDAEKEAA